MLPAALAEMSPDELGGLAEQVLGPEKAARMLALLRHAYGGESPGEFITRMFPAQPPPRHVAPILELFDRARRERVFALVAMPPRHTKTFTCMRSLAWWIGRFPADTNAFVAYSDHKARARSRLIRHYAQRAGVKLGADSNNLSEWRTAQGGGLLAVGMAGGIVGEGITGIALVDDPYKNRQEADSPVIRERIQDLFGETIYTRLQAGSCIVIHTRWHEEDLIGTLRQDPKWQVIELPAICDEPDDLMGRQMGEALWVEGGFDLVELEAIKKTIGDWAFASQYQRLPRPRGATLFGEPSWYDPDQLQLAGGVVYIGADPAATANTRADRSAAFALLIKGAGPTREAWVLDYFGGQMTMPAFARGLVQFQRKWYGCPAAVEAVAGFKAIPQIMEELDPNLRLVDAPMFGDKFQRAQPVSAAWNDTPRRVHWPLKRQWTGDVLKRICRVTGVGDEEDDEADAVAHAWNMGLGVQEIAVHRGAIARPGRWSVR